VISPPTHGSYNVTEGFAETVIPLAKDAAWAKALDVNAAIRATSYSLSGFVTTWKVGSTYSPIDDVRFRVTRSRDIRAANLSELFSGGGGSASAGLNPFRNNETDQFTVSTVGNLNLRPEKSDTTGLGVVLQPSFVPGLSASVDYWNLDISEAIGTLDAQKIINYCFTGNKDLCSAITFGPGQVITLVKNSPFNLVTQIARGIDFEAGYRTPLDALISDAGGDIALRVLATRNLKNFTSNGINIPTDTVGQNSVGGTPTWRWTASATYSNDPVTVDFTGRGVSAGVVDNTFIQCTSACPASTVTHQTVSNNHVDGAVYFDTSITYKIGHRSEIGSDIDLFLNVRNLFNKDPAVVSDGPGGFSFDHAQVNANFYDTLGRVFRAGLRFKM
jgi:outer membrane receptor protein involved in Fe transport